jgi:hypothetical protein
MHDYESLSRPKWECKYHVVLLGGSRLCRLYWGA